MTTMPPDPQDPTGGTPPPPPPGYGPPGAPPAPGMGGPGMPGGPGYGAPVYPGSIPAPPGQWAGPPLASWGQRVLGAIIDGLITGVPGSIVGFASKPLGYLVELAIFLYLMYLQGTTGQTPGKKVMNIKLLREADGQVIGFGLAVGRAFVHIVDALPCGIGYLWPLWDGKKQTFADKILATVVVKA